MWRTGAVLLLWGCRSIAGIEEPIANAPCESTDECGGPYPYCHPETQVCVACAQNPDCASGICDPDGSCVDEARIAYTRGDGTGGECTRAMPCRVQTALVTDKENVLIGDPVIGSLVISRSVRVFAAPGGEIHNFLNGRDPAITIYAGTVELYGLTIVADAIAFGAHGVDVAGKSAVVRLVEVDIANHGGAGVVATGGDVTITRSRIHRNRDGGVRMVAPTKFTISDNFIYENGDAATSAGGVYLDGDASSTFEFNTVIANQSYAQSPYVGGIACTGAYARNNLVYANVHGIDPVQIKGTCEFGNTLFGADAGVVQFVPGDYHLSDATPAPIRDAVECTGFDIDHQRRPRDGACDLGADEFSPP